MGLTLSNNSGNRTGGGSNGNYNSFSIQPPGRLKIFISDIGHASLERFLKSENISIILNTAGGERDRHLPKLGLDSDWV